MKVGRLLAISIFSVSFIFSGCSNHNQTDNISDKSPSVQKNEHKKHSTKSNTSRPVQKGNLFNSLYMIDDNVGWGSTKNSIMYYQNGNWKNITPPQLKAKENTGLYAFNDKIAFVKIDNKVLHTKNSGVNWEESKISSSKDKEKLLNATFSFINENTGWMLVNNGFATGHSPFDIFRTTNQGATWQLILHIGYGNNSTNSLSDTINPNKITFIDNSHGFLTGEANEENEVIFYKTNDSGKTWRKIKLPLPKLQQGELISIAAPEFFDNKNGILSITIRGTKSEYTLFYTTRDQGNTWQYLSKINGSGEVNFLNSQLGWANIKQSISQENTSIYSTKDGGKTWNKESDLSFTLNHLKFTSPLIGWGINENTQQVMRSENGGASWK